MEVAEILIARELGYDGVITTIPKLSVNLFQVMDNQIDRMVEAGVPIIKHQALAERKGVVDRGACKQL